MRMNFALPPEHWLRNRFGRRSNHIAVRACLPSSLHDHVDATQHTDEQDRNSFEPSSSVLRDRDVVEADVHHDVQP